MADKITTGGSGVDGRITVLSADGHPVVDVTALATVNPRRKDAEVAIGGEGRNGVLRIKRSADDRQTTIADNGMSLVGSLSLHSKDKNPVNINPFGDEVKVLLGDTGVSAYVQLTDGSNGPGPIIEIAGKDNALRFGQPGVATSTVEIVGRDGAGRFGGEQVDGSVTVNGADGSPRVGLSGRHGRVRAGDHGANGSFVAVGADGQTKAVLEAANAKLTVGGSGTDGTVSVLGADGLPLVELLARPNESVLGIGQKGRPARISLYGANQQEAIKLDAAAGDILLANADCAELFDVTGPAEPGSVMVITDDGTLAACDQRQDSRVAGVVSGAGDFAPGLILDQRTTAYERAPIALMGKVYCRVDATRSPVRPGDLLTTSQTLGHAERMGEEGRTTGVVLGKALAPLADGTGLIPILVSLH